jgi:hypothetical protein
LISTDLYRSNGLLFPYLREIGRRGGSVLAHANVFGPGCFFVVLDHRSLAEDAHHAQRTCRRGAAVGSAIKQKDAARTAVGVIAIEVGVGWQKEPENLPSTMTSASSSASISSGVI